MIDQNSPAFQEFAGMVTAMLIQTVIRSGGDFEDRSVVGDQLKPWLAEQLAKYEARTKPVTITGLPETLPDGRKIVGWKWDIPQRHDTIIGSWFSPTAPSLHTLNGGIALTFPALIAITEPKESGNG